VHVVHGMRRACPEGALLDGKEAPQLKFIERTACSAAYARRPARRRMTLMPRLLLSREAKSEIVVNRAEPFNCVRCGKPFATRQMMDAMRGD